MMRKWLLPEHVEDILPPEALRIESLRARLLQVFRSFGYELVMPPMLEYIESLLTGTGHDLDLRTFKLIDQISGRTMGVRADMTPQVARIDAHLLNRAGVTRLCYCGTVLHTRPRGFTSTREPLQIGAEIYGHAGIESDIEMQRLLRAALSAAGLAGVRLDVGHVGVFRALAQRADLGAAAEDELRTVLQQKDRAGLAQLTGNLSPEVASGLDALTTLYGAPEVLDRAERELPAYPEITVALAALRALVADNGISMSIDLADLRGYHYHSGVVFAAYASGMPNAIALGGRYDEVGKAFGRARPATGFSIDLRDLARATTVPAAATGILAPWDGDEVDRALADVIARLRTQGEVVVYDLPGHEGSQGELKCDRRLVRRDAAWIIEKRLE